MAVGGRNHHDFRPGRFTCLNACRNIFEYENVAGVDPEAFSTETIALRIGLADGDVFRRDEIFRHRDTRSREPCLGQFQRRRCDDRPALDRQLLQEFGSAAKRNNAFDVIDLSLQDLFRLDDRIDAGQVQIGDRVDATTAVHGRQEFLHIEAHSFRPFAPNTLCGRSRRQDRSIHIEEEGGIVARRQDGLDGSGRRQGNSSRNEW